jgi:signal transduction histidine kinase/CheY-like chemotaxis protein/methyl-accepting chemotaxis protein
MKTLTTLTRSLRKKLIFLFLVVSVLPLITVTILAYTQAENALKTQIINQLITVRDIKANQIERYFRERLANVKLISNHPSTLAAIRAFDNAVKTDQSRSSKPYRFLYLNQPDIVDANDGSAYSAVHAQYHPLFKEYQQAHGYYDIFLVEPSQGTIVYTVEKENDFGTSLIDGLYANTNLGEIFQETAVAKNRDVTRLKDFAFYAPSNGAASFVASPIFDGSQLAGVLILQLPIEQIDSLMQEGTGLGDTSETLLISSEDFLLRSNSRFFKKSSLFKLKADSKASRASAAGNSGVKTVIDYRNELTFIAHKPLSIPNVKWSLNAKIDKAEVEAVVHKLLILISVITGILAVIVAAMAFWVGNSIVKPILIMTQIARQLAAGNMNQTIEIKSQDEIGQMSEAFQQMVTHLRQVINDIVNVSNGIATGNLHVTPQTEYQGDFIQIKTALETARSDLLQVIEDIVQVSQALAEGQSNVKTQAEYRGNFLQIKQALETASVKLTEATAQNTNQNWLKTGHTQLNDQMGGEQELTQLAKNIITFLAKYLEMPVGLFYLLDEGQKKASSKNSNKAPLPDGETKTDSRRLKLIASYAYLHRKGNGNEFQIGDGLVGQAALEQKTLVIAKVPNDYYIQIQSGLGKALPRSLLIQPVMYENTLKGVIELASFKTITEQQQDLITQITPRIGIALNTAQSRYRVQALLQKSQRQTEELQTQAEELQSQSEELQTQQEELSQTNEALEERSKELERQKNDIQAKNMALEQSQQALETKMQELQQASQYKSEFLANMSHELRTPLNSLLILAQLLTENKNRNLTDKQLEYAKTIHSSGADLLSLINDILDLSKVEAGKMELNIEACSLTELVEPLENKFGPLAENKGLDFQISVAENLPPIINTDKQRLQQIINNLLSNAFKFTKQGQIQFTVRHASSDELADLGLEAVQMIAFSVADTGIGIPDDKKQIIFEAFQQADGTTSRRYGGTGLGLSISRQLSRLLGGELYLHSIEGKGSTFTLYLPKTLFSTEAIEKTAETETPIEPPLSEESAAAPPKEDSPNELKTQEQPIDDRNHLSAEDKIILIVEDDPKFSNILADLARQKDYQCLIAPDGRSGLQLASEHKPNAIFLDIGLPQLDGWSVMEKLKDNSDTRHIPVYFISASEQSLEAAKMGAIGYLHKPVNMEQLGAAFNKIEQFLKQQPKKLLAIVENEVEQQKMIQLLDGEDIQITSVMTKTAALQQLQKTAFDCMVLDMNLESQSVCELIHQMQETDRQIPIIIYTENGLIPSEELQLQRCAEQHPIKSVSSPERLLDEVTLFLHQLEARLPNEKRQLLRRVHDKAAILKHKKVLIVDDDMRNVYALATVLEDNNMEVIIGENGQEALNKLQQDDEIAIVLMDVMMPGMDGYEAMRQIRQQPRYRKLPIIALTAKAMKGDKAKCIEAGANDYLSKPVDVDKLISLMRVWLYR